MTNNRVVVAGAALAAVWMTVSGCSDDESGPQATCGQGTELKDGVCVVAGAGGTTQDASAGGSGGAVDGGSGPSDAAADGAGGCSAKADCDDGVECTTDSCSNGTCYHWPGPWGCLAGQVCTLTGCASAPTCATTAECEKQWSSDPCKVDIACDATTSTCTFWVLDEDKDGHPPLACGGDDCDDSSPSKHPGREESCDELDNDCDNEVDDNTVCTGPEGPSCAGGLDCAGVSCCENRRIPGGGFMMGTSYEEIVSEGCDTAMDCEPDEQPEHLVHVSGFYLDTFEVTVGRMRRFLNNYPATPPAEGAGAHPLIPGSGWSAKWNAKVLAKEDVIASLQAESTWTDVPGPNENLPINMVDWSLAFRFCLWDGGRLPTEAEWEFVAAGGVENRYYPWGNATPSDETAVFDCRFFYPNNQCEFQDIAPVGSKPAGRSLWGQYDLAGSMAEYVLDSYQSNWYTAQYPCNDCANVAAYWEKVVRGGNWDGSGTVSLRAASRGWFYMPDDHNEGDRAIGFRCARD